MSSEPNQCRSAKRRARAPRSFRSLVSARRLFGTSRASKGALSPWGYSPSRGSGNTVLNRRKFDHFDHWGAQLRPQHRPARHRPDRPSLAVVSQACRGHLCVAVDGGRSALVRNRTDLLKVSKSEFGTELTFGFAKGLWGFFRGGRAGIELQFGSKLR